MFKKILSLSIILVSLTGCKVEDFKDKIIGFTDENLKQPPHKSLKPSLYVWSDFKDQGFITERKIQIEGEVFNPLVVQDGIIYINRSSGTDELFLYNTDRNTITQLTSRGKAQKKSPIYALRVHNVLYNKGDGTMLPSETKSFAWIEKGDTENKWEIYCGETYKDQSFEAKKIHDFIIPSSDIGKVNEYIESLQINSQYVIWAETTKDMSLTKVYAYEHSDFYHKKQQLLSLDSVKFRVSDDWIIHLNTNGWWYATNFSTGHSFSVDNNSFAKFVGPFIKGNLVTWQRGYDDVIFRDLLTDGKEQLFLSFDGSRNDLIVLAGIQDDILYFKGQRTIYALDMLTLKRANITLPANRLTNVYYKNRFVISQTNGRHTDLYLYEVSF